MPVVSEAADSSSACTTARNELALRYLAQQHPLSNGIWNRWVLSVLDEGVWPLFSMPAMQRFCVWVPSSIWTFLRLKNDAQFWCQTLHPTINGNFGKMAIDLSVTLLARLVAYESARNHERNRGTHSWMRPIRWRRHNDRSGARQNLFL